MDTSDKNKFQNFLKGGGESAELIAQYDWSTTSIGDVKSWPLSLQITLGNILHSAFPMVLFWGDELNCFYNDAFRPSLGNEGKHPGIGKKAKELWHDVWDFIGPLLEDVLQGKNVFFEDQLVPFYRNGHTENIYWTFSCSPALNNDGAIEGILVTCMETTASVLNRISIEKLVAERTAALQKANSSLLVANEYLQNIINVFKEPLQILEPIMQGDELVDFRYKLTNASYSAYANTSPDKLQGKKVGDVFPGYFQTTSFTNIAEVYSAGQMNTWDIHYTEDGLNLYNKMSAAKLGNEVLVHFTDFTEIKNLQLELERKVEQLQNSNQQLEEFAYIASHDLKEPIRKISIFTGQLRMLLNDNTREDVNLLFQRLEKATGRMGALVDDLLQYSHVTGRPSEKEEIELSSLISNVTEILEMDISQKNASIQVLNTAQLSGYRRQLQQLFQNLISNGLKYNKAAEQIVIIIDTRQVEVSGVRYNMIEVKDNGIGFESGFAEKIFEMFVRLHGKSEYSGTGIGLAIVKKVVDNHEGFIKAESAPGKGASFKVYLPV